MASTSRQEQRRERLHEFQAQLDRAGAAASALALLVQGREARRDGGGGSLEVRFAEPDAAGVALPAALWVALRRGDIEMAVQLLARASGSTFVVGEREEMGSGYRLETVAETRALPDIELLQARLAAVLDIPPDVVAVLAEWGADDPRTHAEVAALLDSRFGAASAGPEGADGADAAVAADGIGAPTAGPGVLRMSVDELAAVLQLAPAQATVLATLAGRAALTITPSAGDGPGRQ